METINLWNQTWMIGVQQLQGAEQVTSGGAPRTRGLRMTEITINILDTKKSGIQMIPVFWHLVFVYPLYHQLQSILKYVASLITYL